MQVVLTASESAPASARVAASPRLVPELVVSDLARSFAFYREVLGFEVRYERLDERFAYLDREGAHLMIEQPTGRSFVAGDLRPPFGRGVNLQIEVADIAALHDRVRGAGIELFLPLEDRWYRRDATLLGNRQFVVHDPDGYLLRFFQDLGARPA
ncbi:MAG: bleomycin resistance protein [Dehalococcoidia bacterium]